jgi:type IV pilus assembly protein PilP
MSRVQRAIALCAVLGLGLGLSGCGGGRSDLEKWVAETKKRPGGRIEPVREVKPYESFAYDAGTRRSPFQPQGAGAISGQPNLRPSSRRNREFLEGISLDTMKMVGTLRVGGNFYGLVQSKDGLVHKVQPGNYLGQNDGKITGITASKISLVEIVPDGLGGYVERPASLALTD